MHGRQIHTLFLSTLTRSFARQCAHVCTWVEVDNVYAMYSCSNTYIRAKSTDLFYYGFIFFLNSTRAAAVHLRWTIDHGAANCCSSFHDVSLLNASTCRLSLCRRITLLPVTNQWDRMRIVFSVVIDSSPSVRLCFALILTLTLG